MVSQTASTAEKKASVELERAQAELAALQRPFWKRVEVIGPCIAFFLSAIGNAYQFTRTATVSEGQLTLERAQWDDQREKLNAEIVLLKQQAVHKNEQKEYMAGVLQDIAKEEKNVNTWRDAVSRSEVKILHFKGQISTMELSPGSSDDLNTLRGQLADEENALSLKKAGLEKSEQKKKSLEDVYAKQYCD